MVKVMMVIMVVVMMVIMVIVMLVIMVILLVVVRMVMMMMLPDKHGYGGVEGVETKGCWTDFVSHFNLKITR